MGNPTVAELRQHLKTLEAAYNTRNGQYEQLTEDHEKVSARLMLSKDENRTLEQCRVLLQRVGKTARETAKERLEETVTDALKFVFGPDFNFSIDLRDVRGRTEADFYVESIENGKVIRTQPEDARGGGVIDIIAIALRLALVQIYTDPVLKGPIILDEPGKHVSADYSMKLATFLKQMSQSFDRQIIVSTHQPNLASLADEAHYVEIKGGKSIVRAPDSN